MALKNQFPQRLKELREEKGLSIKTLAKELGVSDIAIGRWEKGLRTPNIDALILVANYFNVSADYLLGLKDY